MYALMASQSASAAGDIVVRPSSMSGWNQNGRNISFTDAQAKIGNGSVRFSTKGETQTTGGQKHVRTNAFANTKLTDITELSYSSFVEERTGLTVAPLIRMDVRLLNTNTQLVWEPIYGAGITQGAWQDYNPLTQGKWNVTTATGAGTIFPNKETWVSWSAIIAADPSAYIRSVSTGSVSLSAGQNNNTQAPWTGFVGYVDNFKFNGTSYDLEPNVVAPAAPTITSPAEAADVTTLNGEVTVEWNTVTGAESYLVSIDGGAPSPVIGGGTEFTTVLAAGPHTVTVQSVGSSNLLGGTSQLRHFSIVIPQSPTNLNVKETVSGNSVVHLGYTNKDKLTASWTAPVNGADSYIYTYWNDVTTSPYTAASPWTSPTSATSYPGTVNQGEGVHHWAVRSVKNGVASDLSTTYTYTYDKTRPEVALVSPADGAQNPANYVVKATDNFALKTVTGHIYNADNTVFVKNCSKTATPAETNEYLLDCATAGLGDGTYTIRYNALDMAGNLSATKTSKFIIDHTAPTATLSYSPNGPAWTKNSVTVTLTASEPIKQSALPGTWLKVSDTVYKKVYPVNAVQNVTLEDLAGNTGSVTVAIDWIDKVAPTAAINAPALTNSSNPHIEGIASDTLSGVNSHWFEIKAPNGTFYYVYGTNNFDLSEAKDNTVDKNPIVITEGAYQIRYVVTDKAGNRSDDPNYTHSTLHTMTIDMTAPTVAIDSIADSTNTAPIISGVTSEKGGNVKISLNGTEVAVVTSDVDGNWSWTVSPELAVGDYTAGAIAVDGAGNESSVATTDFAILAQPTGPTGPTNPTNPGNPGGPTSEQPDPDAETPTQTENDEDDTTPTIAFLPQTISGANPGAAGTGVLPIGDGNQSVGDVAGATADAEAGKTDILGTEDTKAGWSLINAVMAGLVVLLGVVALAGIRRNSEGNHTGTRVLTVIPAAAAAIVFFVVETVSAPMTWVNVWTWLFAAILVVQIILLSVAKPTSDS